MVEDVPLLVIGQYGEGRAIAYTTDIGPHNGVQEILRNGTVIILYGETWYIGSRMLNYEHRGTEKI